MFNATRSCKINDLIINCIGNIIQNNKDEPRFFIQRLVHIYLSFVPVSDSLKEAYKNEETEALSRSEIPRYYNSSCSFVFFLLHLHVLSSVSFRSSVLPLRFQLVKRAQAGKGRQAGDDSREIYALVTC